MAAQISPPETLSKAPPGNRQSLCGLLVLGMVFTALLPYVTHGQVEAEGRAAVHESTGSATYALKLGLPPGTAGHGPELALVYASDDIRGGARWMGVGWSLAGTSTIHRSLKFGPPYDHAQAPPLCESLDPVPVAAPCYRLDFALDGEDLIQVGEDPDASRIRYKTQKDDGRLIHYLPGSASDPTDDQWEIRDRDGRTHWYGAGTGSTVVNPNNGEIFSWHLSVSMDRSSNWIIYSYTAGVGVLHPETVSYGPSGEFLSREVAFILDDVPTPSEVRPDAALSYRAGFRQAWDRRLARIEIKAKDASGSLAVLSRYVLKYEQEPFSNRSRLSSVTQETPTGESLPKYEFAYSDITPGFETDPKEDFAGSSGLGVDAPLSVAYSLNDADGRSRALLDLNGDGFVDVYDWSQSGQDPGHAYLSDGEQLSAAIPWWTENYSFKAITLEYPEAIFRRTAIRVLDANGDGIPDVAENYLTPGPPDVRLGSTTGLRTDPSEIQPIPIWNELGLTQYDSQDVRYHDRRRMMDLTGDGRADLVDGFDPNVLTVTPSIGNDLDLLAFGPSQAWPMANSTALNDVQAADPFEIPPSWFVSSVEMFDMNADGLMDQMSSTGTGVQFNFGIGFESPPAPLPNAYAFTNSSTTGPIENRLACAESARVDLSGNGCLDQIFYDPTNAAFVAHFGMCDGELNPPPFISWPAVLPADGCAVEPARFADINGDGLADYAHDVDTIYLNPNVPPGLLVSATEPTGKVTKFSYASAASFRDPGGGPANARLPAPRMVVTEIRRTDVLREQAEATQTPPPDEAVTPIVDRYSYYDADFDRIEREFRGFGRVVRTRIDPDSSPLLADSGTVRLYATDFSDPGDPYLGRACSGQVVLEEVFEGDPETPPSPPLRRVINEYDTSRGQGTRPDAWEKCVLTETRVEWIEGGPEAERRIVRSELSWDTVEPFNLLERKDWGEVVQTGTNPQTGEPEFGDTGQDGRTTTLTYATRTSALPTDPYLVSAPYDVAVWDLGAAQAYEVQRFCYDNTCDGSISAGFVTTIQGYYDLELTFVDLQRITYDTRGNPIQRRGPATPSAPNGTLRTVGYDTLFHTFPLTVTDGDVGEPTLTQKFVYGDAATCGLPAGAPTFEGFGLPCQEISPQDLVRRTEYDGFGRPVRVDEPSGLVVERAYQYPASGDAGVTLTDTAWLGLPQQSESFVFTTELDALGRTIASAEPGTASPAQVLQTEFRYDFNGRLLQRTVPSADPAAAPYATMEYDALGRLTRAEDLRAPLQSADTQFMRRYQPLVVIEETFFDSATPPDLQSRQSYKKSGLDGLSRLAWTEVFEDATPPPGTPPPGDLTGGYRTQIEYDPAGRLIKVEDPIRSSWDGSQSPLCGGLGPHCGAAGRHETVIAWDTLGRRRQITDPDAGIRTFTYDHAGNVTVAQDGLGNASTYAYDPIGRVVSRTLSGPGAALGVSSASFVYGTTAGPEYGLLKEVNATSSEGTSYDFAYDFAGRLATETQTTDGFVFTTSYLYDEADRVTSWTPPGMGAVQFFYNGTRLISMHDTLMDIEYEDDGRIRSYKSGQTTVTRTYDPSNARLTGIRAVNSGDPPVEVMDLTLGFDGLQRNTTFSGHVNNPGVTEMSRSFTYDGIGRLKEAMGEWERPHGNAAATKWTFSYDPLGNLRSQVSDLVAGGSGVYSRTWVYDHPTKPRALTAFTETINGTPITDDVSYDAAGNVSQVIQGPQTHAYQWNAQGLFAGIENQTPGYHYDVFGARVMQKWSAQDRVIYIGERSEWNQVDGWVNHFFRLEGQLVATRGLFYQAPASFELWPLYRFVLRPVGLVLLVVGGGVVLLGLAGLAVPRPWRTRPIWARATGAATLGIGLVLYPIPAGASSPPSDPGTHGSHRATHLVYLTDHLGSVRGVWNSFGDFIEERDYGPFGEFVEHTGTFDLKHQFTGQARDADLDLEFFNARMFNRRWARFISTDVQVQALDSEGMNRYSYVGNRPTSLVDPTGNFIEGLFAVGAAFGLFASSSALAVFGEIFAGIARRVLREVGIVIEDGIIRIDLRRAILVAAAAETVDELMEDLTEEQRKEVQRGRDLFNEENRGLDELNKLQDRLADIRAEQSQAAGTLDDAAKLALSDRAGDLVNEILMKRQEVLQIRKQFNDLNLPQKVKDAIRRGGPPSTPSPRQKPGPPGPMFDV